MSFEGSTGRGERRKETGSDKGLMRVAHGSSCVHRRPLCIKVQSDRTHPVLLSRASQFSSPVHNQVIFSFFCMSAECPSRLFVKFVTRLATKCRCKKSFSHEKWVQLDKKTTGSVCQKLCESDRHLPIFKFPRTTSPVRENAGLMKCHLKSPV